MELGHELASLHRLIELAPTSIVAKKYDRTLFPGTLARDRRSDLPAEEEGQPIGRAAPQDQQMALSQLVEHDMGGVFGSRLQRLGELEPVLLGDGVARRGSRQPSHEVVYGGSLQPVELGRQILLVVRRVGENERLTLTSEEMLVQGSFGQIVEGGGDDETKLRDASQLGQRSWNLVPLELVMDGPELPVDALQVLRALLVAADHFLELGTRRKAVPRNREPAGQLSGEVRIEERLPAAVTQGEEIAADDGNDGLFLDE